jgi:hypothetical protein
MPQKVITISTQCFLNNGQLPINALQQILFQISHYQQQNKIVQYYMVRNKQIPTTNVRKDKNWMQIKSLHFLSPCNIVVLSPAFS